MVRGVLGFIVIDQFSVGEFSVFQLGRDRFSVVDLSIFQLRGDRFLVVDLSVFQLRVIGFQLLSYQFFSCGGRVFLVVGWFYGGCGFGCGVGGGVGVEEVGVAGEGVMGLAVDEEADGGDLGEGGVEGSYDRFDGQGFDLDAGRVIVDETAAEVDDG